MLLFDENEVEEEDDDDDCMELPCVPNAVDGAEVMME
jgi:hypothetical protein